MVRPTTNRRQFLTAAASSVASVPPLIYDREGTTHLKMGDWMHKVPPVWVSGDAELAAMDASVIDITLLATSDPGLECSDYETRHDTADTQSP